MDTFPRSACHVNVVPDWQLPSGAFSRPSVCAYGHGNFGASDMLSNDLGSMLRRPLLAVWTTHQSTFRRYSMGTRIDDVRKATDEAAKQMSGILAAFQVAFVYVGIAVGHMSDADYLTGTGVMLPIVASTVPTKVFLIVAPILVLILHLALLLQWAMFHRQVQGFLTTLNDEVWSEREPQLRMLYPFVLGSCLIPAEQRRRFRWPASILVVLGLVAVPLSLLIAIQVRSLAFHESDLTWVQRLLALADLGAVWIYFPLMDVEKLGTAGRGF